MQNPYPTDPIRPFRLNDEDDDEHEDGPGGCDSGAKGGDGSLLDRHLLASRTVVLAGPVSDKLAQFCQVRLLAMERMDKERPITVLINSPGGSADSGFAIYDMLRFVQPPIRTIVNGLCASAAILIGLAAEKKDRYALPESRFLIHQPSTTGQGTASDLDITAREIIKLRERYNRIIAERTGQNPEKVLTDAKRDFWLNAKEALEYGLISKVVRKRSELPE